MHVSVLKKKKKKGDSLIYKEFYFYKKFPLNYAFFFFFSFSPSSFLLALGRVEIWKPANWLQRDEREGGVEGKGEKGERERKFIATRACVFLILKDRNFRRQGE